MSTTYNEAFNNLNKVVSQLREKQAADQGDKDTTHPSKNEDNQADPATEGPRSSENESDTSETTPGVSINDGNPEDAHKKPEMDSLINADTSGEDPANETSSAKKDKQDPGTSHPSEMDGTENGTQKSAMVQAIDSVDALIKEQGVEKVASELIDMVSDDLLTIEKVAAEARTKGLIAAIEKQAAYDVVEERLEGQVKNNLKTAAADWAEELSEYMNTLNEKRSEAGAEEPVPGEEPEAGDAGGEGALPPEDLEQLAAAAAGEGAVEEAPVEGMPAEEALGLAEEGPTEEVVEALSEALSEAGITPEELAMAVEAEQGAVEGPIEERAAIADQAKMACAKVNHYRNLLAAGRIKNEKRASINLKYAMHKLVKEYADTIK